MGVDIGIPYLAELSYIAIPLVLFLGSIGVLPVMEEIVLLVVGYGVFAGIFNSWLAVLMSVASVVLVDNLHFYFCSHGHTVLRRFLNGKVLARVQRAVDERGPIAVFIARFIPGMRILTPWVAATSGMRWRKFVAANALGALIQTPLMVWIGYLLGPKVEHGIAVVRSVDHLIPLALLIIAVLAAIIICLYRKNVRHLVRQLGGANGRS